MKFPLPIKAQEHANGISIHVKNREFKIEYPKGIWQKTPKSIRRVLLENLTFANTHFLPLILKKDRIRYDTPFPLFESYLFKNHMCDLIDTERVDKAPFLSYIQKLYNLDFEFARRESTIPDPHEIPRFKTTPATAIIPFTFGKESLLSFALAREMGIKPILVYFQDPVEKYEEAYKLKKIEAFKKQHKVDIYFVKNDPGLFKCGIAFGTPKTDLGWGVQITLLTLLSIPFVYAHQAQYILYGSEYANNEFEYVNGWKLFHSYDQTTVWTKHKNNMVRLLTNNQCQVKTTLEMNEEINIFYTLHHRYPELGKDQFTCRGEKPLYGGSQWCHKCYKCARIFLFAKACGIDPYTLGFKKDIFKKTMYRDYFDKTLESGSFLELDFAFYAAYKRGIKHPLITLFKNEKLPDLKPWKWFRNYYTSLRPEENLPEAYRAKLQTLFLQELKQFKKTLPK